MQKDILPHFWQLLHKLGDRLLKTSGHTAPCVHLVQGFVDFLEGVRRHFALRRDDDADVDDDELVARRQLAGAPVRQEGGRVVGVVHVCDVAVRRELDHLKAEAFGSRGCGRRSEACYETYTDRL